jgi:hypothetical protein
MRLVYQAGPTLASAADDASQSSPSTLKSIRATSLFGHRVRSSACTASIARASWWSGP